MRAVVYDRFGGPMRVESLPDPTPPVDGVVVRVGASGICRSDWHGWIGHEPDIQLPHVPGHELAGEVESVGGEVRRWRVGDRVTVPFAVGCGRCPPCQQGHLHICDRGYQPGFSGWGSFAERVALPHADLNLVRLPDELDFVSTVSLGCRLTTAYRALIQQGCLTAGEWIAVHGCGGVGLGAVMIAAATEARVIAVDVKEEALAMAESVGAVKLLNARETDCVPRAIREITGGGAHLSLDALGSEQTARNSVSCLRKRGRHVQVGLLLGDQENPRLPMHEVIARELEIVGSHGMPAGDFQQLLELILNGRVEPARIVRRTVNLEESIAELTNMTSRASAGITVINRFSKPV